MCEDVMQSLGLLASRMWWRCDRPRGCNFPCLIHNTWLNLFCLWTLVNWNALEENVVWAALIANIDMFSENKGQSVRYKLSFALRQQRFGWLVKLSACSLSLLLREDSNFSQLIKPLHENCEEARCLLLVLPLLLSVISRKLLYVSSVHFSNLWNREL